MTERAAKVCATCGRRFAWRKRWARDWEAVRHCGERCRRARPGPVDAHIEAAILAALASRAHDATLCPSEVARACFGDGWRAEMERVRRAARRLVAAGQLEITQRGAVVDPSTARGPIRLRRVGPPAAPRS